MLKSYLKIAVRNLRKHKLSSFINIFGLATGMTVCLLAVMSVKDAMEYDNFHPYPDRTYRVITNVTARNGNTRLFASSPLPLSQVLQQEYSFVEKTARIYYGAGNQASYNRKTLPAHGAFVDADFYTVFNFALQSGVPAVEPYTVVVTPETATRFFGKESPIGKVLTIAELGQFTVTGVLKLPPHKSHLRFDLLASMTTVPLLEQRGKQSQRYGEWKDYSACYTYVLLKDGVPAETFNQVLPTVAKRALNGVQLESDRGYTFRSQVLSRISPAADDMANSTWEMTLGQLLLQGGVALLILVLAGFNYINLTLTRSLNRAKEVGVRKVAGAVRWQLVGQFLTESVVITFLSLLLASILLQFIKPLAFVQTWLIPGVRQDAVLYLYFLLFALVTGVVAGLLPAWLLSSYQPAQVLRGQLGTRFFGGGGLHKGLVMIQFIISLVAIIFAMVVHKQFTYMATASYGFNRENSINIELQGTSPLLLASEMSRLAGVKNVSLTSNIMGFQATRRRASPDRWVSNLDVHFLAVDAAFVGNMDLTMVAGENLPLSVKDSADNFILINEKAVNVFKLKSPAEALGQQLWLDDSSQVQIVGVLKDFNYRTLSRPIEPLVLRYQPNQFRYLNARVDRGAVNKIVPEMEQVWRRLNQYDPFVAQWYDDKLSTHMNADDQLFFALLTAMILSIASLGLLGMVTYSTKRRVKEVGIRKVMGARVDQIIFLLSRSFIRMLLIAGLIALPLGYMAGMAFLWNFTYHVQIGFFPLFICLGVMLLVGSTVIGFQVFKAASTNPVNSLRTE